MGAKPILRPNKFHPSAESESEGPTNHIHRHMQPINNVAIADRNVAFERVDGIAKAFYHVIFF